jgi:ABC-type dipeptide/oligopeptide/nickel transport system permease subunit
MSSGDETTTVWNSLAAAVSITVLVFIFLGDGLRDAADPYH